MSYSTNHPVRRAGGRLSLDFLNTADWSEDGGIVHEKLQSLEDLSVWRAAVGLPDALLPESLPDALLFRSRLRDLFLSAGKGKADVSLLMDWIASTNSNRGAQLETHPLMAHIAYSALSILGDPKEHGRIKHCPGQDCGWLFIDETKNARRRWCQMETCGNRAKAQRNYKKRKAGANSPG